MYDKCGLVNGDGTKVGSLTLLFCTSLSLVIFLGSRPPWFHHKQLGATSLESALLSGVKVQVTLGVLPLGKGLAFPASFPYYNIHNKQSSRLVSSVWDSTSSREGCLQARVRIVPFYS